MKKSKKHSDNSTKPTKREKEPQNAIPDVDDRPQSEKTIWSTLKRWAAIFGIFNALFWAGYSTHKWAVSIDEIIQRRDNEIKTLTESRKALSGKIVRLEKEKQDLNKEINSQTQEINSLKQDLQTTNNELNNLREENKRPNSLIDSLTGEPLGTYEVIIDLSDFVYQIPDFKIFLNDTLKAQGKKNNFKLRAEEGVYNLRIEYTDKAVTTWEFSDSIIFEGPASEKSVEKSHFKRRD